MSSENRLFPNLSKSCKKSILKAVTILSLIAVFSFLFASDMMTRAAGNTSAFKKEHISQITPNGLWCEMHKGLTLWVTNERALSRTLFLSDIEGGERRHFELAREGEVHSSDDIIESSRYIMKGVNFPAVGHVDIYRRRSEPNKFEVSVYADRHIDRDFKTRGDCYLETTLSDMINDGVTGRTAWEAISVDDKIYSYRDILIGGKEGVAYEFASGLVKSSDENHQVYFVGGATLKDGVVKAQFKHGQPLYTDFESAFKEVELHF